MGRRILILGSGVCGLAAGYRLLERDSTLDVTILETEERPGGLARSLTIDGQVTDLGPHRIYTELPDVQDFLQDLVGDQLETVRRKSEMWLRGQWIEYPPKPAEMIRLLGAAKIVEAGASWALGKAGKVFARESRQRESFKSLMVEAFGQELYNLLVGPYAKKVWKVDPATMHADIARVRVSAGGLDQMVKKLFVREKAPSALKKFYYIAGGVENLVKKLAEGVEARGGKILTRHDVVGLKPFRTGHWQVKALDKAANREKAFQAENVVSTIPLPELLGHLLPHKPNQKVEKARDELRYIANFLVMVVAKRPRVTPNTWLYFPEKDTIFNRGYEPKNFHPSMGTPDKSMLVLEITCHHGDKIWNASDKQLTEATLKGLERIGLLGRDEIAGTHVHRIPHTYPLYDLDYRERLGKIWKYLENFPRLISSGRQGLFLHNNMDHSIHMGFRAAERLMESEEDPASRFYTEIRRFQQFRIVD